MLGLIWIISIVATVWLAAQNKRSTIGYFLLSVFLGPIALIIFLLSEPKDRTSSSGAAPYSPASIQEELARLKRMSMALQERIANLENVVHGSADIAENIKSAVSLNKLTQPSIEKVQKEQSQNEAFEMVFGKYWLNRIGVVVLVLGVGFFISYSFQYLGPVAKIAIGYVLSMIFLWWGHFLEKKEKYQKVAWGILGGGWGLLYLSSFAMHYIEATRIITSQTLELIILTAVTAWAIFYNLKYKSWVVSALTFILAFITMCLGRMEFSTVVYSGLLCAAMMYLSIKLNWHEFLIFGIWGVGCANLFLHFETFGSRVWGPGTSLNTHFIMLSLDWCLFLIGLLLMNILKNPPSKYMVSGQLLNAAFFIALGYMDLVNLSAGVQKRFVFAMILAGIYFLIAYLNKVYHRPKMIVVNCSVAAFLLTMGILIRVPDLGIGVLWMLEAAMLFILGAYYKEYIYRILSGFLSVMVLVRLYLVDLGSSRMYSILGLGIDHDVLVFSFTVAIFYVLGTIANFKDVKRNFQPEEENVYYAGFSMLGTLLFVSLLNDVVASKWLSLSWTVCGLSVLGLGFLLKHRAFRFCGLSVVSLALFRVVVYDMAEVNTIYKIMAFIFLGAVLVGISLIYSRIKIKDAE